jgi:WD40 repeat protein
MNEALTKDVSKDVSKDAAKTAADTAAEKTVQPKELKKIETDRQVCLIRFSRCGQFLFGGGYDAVIRRWDMTVDEPQLLAPIVGHHGWVQAIEFAPVDEVLYSVDSWGMLSARPYRDENAEPIWSVETAHDGWIRDVSVSADGRLIATAGRDRFVRVWSAVDGKLQTELPQHEHDLCRVAIHPDGKSIVSGDLKGIVRHWDIESKKCVREVDLFLRFYDRIQDVPGIYVLRFNEAGDTLICAGGKPTRTGNHQGIPTVHQVDWNTLKTKRKQTFGVDKDGFVFDLAWHRDGYFLAVTSGNPGAGQFLLARPDSDKAFFTYTKFSNCHTLALHPDGKTVVVAATNRNSQGNGAVRDKAGTYVGNSSPLHVFDLSGT